MTKDMAHRFLDPKSPRQRRYEALRARFVEGCPTDEAARRAISGSLDQDSGDT